MVTKSRWVIPTRLQREGFYFKWANLGEGLEHLRKRPGLQALQIAK